MVMCSVGQAAYGKLDGAWVWVLLESCRGRVDIIMYLILGVFGGVHTTV